MDRQRRHFRSLSSRRRLLRGVPADLVWDSPRRDPPRRPAATNEEFLGALATRASCSSIRRA